MTRQHHSAPNIDLRVRIHRSAKASDDYTDAYPAALR